MKNETREAFNGFCNKIAQLSGVSSAAEQFSVAPSVQQNMERAIQDSSEFLSQVNVIGVTSLAGQRLGIGVSRPIAGRTNTEVRDRETRDVAEISNNEYECVPTEFDTSIKWAKLDAWAHNPGFQLKVRDAITRRQALDRIMIGFNGTHAAVSSDREVYPELQDLNKGWLQQYRDKAPERILSEGASPGEVRVGPGGDYENLDALIFDVTNEMIDPWHREAESLRALSDRHLVADKYFQAVSNHGDTPTELAALDSDMYAAFSRFGGVVPARVPHMPAGTIFITPPENLSIYWQEGSRRRFVIDNPKRNRVEDYQSSNDAYVVEDFGAGCLVENIVFGEW